MRYLVCVLFMVLWEKQDLVSGDYFSSTDQLKTLVEIENDLINGLSGYIFETRRILNEVER